MLLFSERGQLAKRTFYGLAKNIQQYKQNIHERSHPRSFFSSYNIGYPFPAPAPAPAPYPVPYGNSYPGFYPSPAPAAAPAMYPSPPAAMPAPAPAQSTMIYPAAAPMVAPAAAPSSVMYPAAAAAMAAPLMFPASTFPGNTFAGSYPGNTYPHHYNANEDIQPDRNEVFTIKGRRKYIYRSFCLEHQVRRRIFAVFHKKDIYMTSTTICGFYIHSINFLLLNVSDFKSIGCWTDSVADRAINSLEGKHPLLKDTNYKARSNALMKCAEAAMDKKFKFFALQNGGQCFGQADQVETYKKHGPSVLCKGISTCLFAGQTSILDI